MSAITPTYTGEIQLAGWSESHTGGCKVTFWLQGPDDLSAFRTLTTRKGNTAGHRFMAALVEIGDDELPVQPTPIITDYPDKPKGGVLAVLAGRWCQDPEFWAWFTSIGHYCENAIGAAESVRYLCDIKSRADLDHDPAAAEKFHRLIRGEFSKYVQARG